MRCKAFLGILFLVVFGRTAEIVRSQGGSTSTAWRNDEANIEVVRELNRAVEQPPFSTDFEGVLDDCPFRIDWTVGPNVPLPWKGGVSGVFGQEIALAGGGWDGNPAFSYNVKTQSYEKIPPPPVGTSFTQGTSDKDHLYLVGGKSAGQIAAKLARTDTGWKWTPLAPVPEANRWTATVGVVDKWLFLYGGMITAKAGRRDRLPAWRLRLDSAQAQWQPMAPFPGKATSVINGAVARGKLYAFGGWREHDGLVAHDTAVA